MRTTCTCNQQILSRVKYINLDYSDYKMLKLIFNLTGVEKGICTTNLPLPAGAFFRVTNNVLTAFRTKAISDIRGLEKAEKGGVILKHPILHG